MRQLPVLVLLSCLVVMSAPAVAADGRPLFASGDTLELVLEVPVRTLLRQAKKKPVLPGKLFYADAGGNTIPLDIEITTRGRSRLELCSFPPVSIFLRDDTRDGTVFEGQRKLKIVTQCKDGSKFLDYLHQEYGIYKAYNAVSDYSFRVRWLKVTWRDSKQKRKDEAQPAFFIESEEEAAQRLGMTAIRTPRVKLEQLDPTATSIYGLFQYLIANTDWSIKKGPGAEDCCHNGKLIGPPGSRDHWVVLAYDFDQSGLLNTDYALPAEGLGIRTVRTRLYRGRCLHNDLLTGTISLFNERREAIEAALVPKTLSQRTQKSAKSYIEEFYETINDPQARREKIISQCLIGR